MYIIIYQTPNKSSHDLLFIKHPTSPGVLGVTTPIV